jgi:twitching motility protein PilT
MVTIQHLLKAVIDKNATDLHIAAGHSPSMRVNGQVTKVKMEPLSPDQAKQMCFSILTDVQKATFEETKELDFSFGIKGLARFRGNLFFQKGHVSAAFRRIPIVIPKLEDLGLPQSVAPLLNASTGMILVTGPTGSGKTTTIASMIDRLNETTSAHILTIEDPIEYIHEPKGCVVNQREVGPDTWSFRAAVKHMLRQDPDYCLIGEMRDLDTIEEAMRVAETGHLVFGTLHTNSAIQTISRIVTVFPGDQQERIRVLLSFILQGIVAQQLLPGIDGGLVCAVEVLIPTPAIRNLIRENKMHQIYGVMQMGQNKTGMITMNQSLMSLLLKRKVDMRVAFEASPDPEELDGMLKKAGI